MLINLFELARPNIYFIMKVIGNNETSRSSSNYLDVRSSNVEDVFIVGHKNMDSCSFADL